MLQIREVGNMQVVGDLSEARPLIEEALKLAIENLSAEDPQYVLAFSRMASLCFLEHNEELAAQFLEKVEPTAEVLGKTHFEYFGLLNNLAVCYLRIGRASDAIPLMQRVVDSKRNHFGVDSPEYLGNLEDLVLALDKADRFGEAVPHIREMLSIVRKHFGEDSQEYALMSENLANARSQAGNNAGANNPDRTVRKSSKKRSRKPNKNERDDVHQVLDAYAAEDYPQARILHKKLLAALPQLPVFGPFEDVLGPMLDPIRPHISELDEKGVILENAEDYEAAAHAYRQVFEMMLTTLGGRHPDLAQPLSKLALVRQKQGRYDEAKILYAEAISLLGHKPEVAECWHTLLANVANLFMELCDKRAPWPGDNLKENFSGASDKPANFTFAPRIRFPMPLDGEDPVSAAARKLDARAKFYESTSDAQRARFLYESALEMTRLAWGSDLKKTLKPIRELSTFYLTQAIYGQALELSEEAIRVCNDTTGPDSMEVVQFLRIQARVLVELANYDKAEEAILQAITIAGKRFKLDHPNIQSLEDDLLTMKLRGGAQEGAQALIQKKLDRLQLDSEKEVDPEEIQRLGAFAGLAKNYKLAERLLRKAMVCQRKSIGEWDPRYALSVANLGSIHRATGRFEEAIKCFEQASTIRRTWFGPRHTSVAKSQARLALTLASLHRYDEALKAIQESLQIGDGLIAEVRGMSSQRQLLQFLIEQKHMLDLALTILITLCKSRPEFNQLALELVLRRKGLSGDALASRRLPILNGRYPQLQDKLQELDQLSQLLVQARLNNAKTDENVLEEARRRRDRLEEELSRAIPELRLNRQLSEFSVEKLCKQLPENSVLVEYFRYNPTNLNAVTADGDAQELPAHYLVFVAQSGKPEQLGLLDLGLAEGIERNIDEFGRRVAGNTGGFPRHLGNEHAAPHSSLFLETGQLLFKVVFEPVMSLLGGKNNLFLAPDAALSLLSFDVLPLGSNRYIIDDYQLNHLGSGRDLLRADEIYANPLSAPVILAGPDYDLCISSNTNERERHYDDFDSTADRSLQRLGLTLPPLPGAAAEGREISTLLNNPRLYSDADALESTVRSWKSPAIVHLATHGFYVPEIAADGAQQGPLIAADGAMISSALALAGANTWIRGGSLPAEAEDGILTADDVATLNLIGTELVVLSACRSGVGAVVFGEGIFGLRRAFLVAGARTLIMSLWQIPDAETKELMVLFYLALRDGKTKPEALRHAKLTMRKKHPFYWGSFICEGDWGHVPNHIFSPTTSPPTTK